MARFDVKRVNPLEWAGVVAGAAASVVLRAPWFEPNDWERDVAERSGIDPDPVGWDVGLLAQLGILLLVAGAIAVLLPHLGIRVPWRSVIWISSAFVALLLIQFGRNNYGGPLVEDGYRPDVSIWFHVAAGATWISLAAGALNARLGSKPV
jgi:hypothetical protein